VLILKRPIGHSSMTGEIKQVLIVSF